MHRWKSTPTPLPHSLRQIWTVDKAPPPPTPFKVWVFRKSKDSITHRQSDRHTDPPTHYSTGATREHNMALCSRLFPFAALALLLAASELVGHAAAATYVVGDSMGWTIPSSPYANWASRHSFHVGDILVFNFPTGAHDVVRVAKADYDGCSGNNPIGRLITIGPANITLDSTGPNFFICTFTQHCSSGQKLAINVTAASPTPAPTPSPTSPPARGTPPPAVTPTPAPPSPPTSPTPSPSISQPPTPSPTLAPPPPSQAPAPTPSGTGAPSPSSGEPSPSLPPSPSSGGGPSPSLAPGSNPSPPAPPGAGSSPAPGASPPSPPSPSSSMVMSSGGCVITVAVLIFYRLMM